MQIKKHTKHFISNRMRHINKQKDWNCQKQHHITHDSKESMKTTIILKIMKIWSL